MPQFTKVDPQRFLGHRAAIYAVAEGLDADTFLTGAGEGWVVVWPQADPENGKLLAQAEGNIFSLLAIPEINGVVAGNMIGGLHWIDLERPERTKDIKHHSKGTYALLRLGDQVLSGGGGGKLSRWSIEERRAIESLQLTHAAIRGLAHAPDRREIAVATSDHSIYLLDEQLAVKQQIDVHGHSVFCVCYSPDQRLLISGGRDAQLTITDLVTGSSERIPAHTATINALAFSPDGHYLATAGRDRTIKIWDSGSFDLLKVLETVRDDGHRNSVNDLLWTEQGLISVSDDRSGILWRIN